jgi:hypothetical protein
MDLDGSAFLDFFNASQARIAIERQVEEARSIGAAEADRAEYFSVPAPAEEETGHPLGRLASATWRRFVIGVFVADWACYGRPADRVDFLRLLSILAVFPQGFRLWVGRLADGRQVPFGYSGWYPIDRCAFDRLRSDPGGIGHRRNIVPLQGAKTDRCHAYLFNVSIIPALYRSRQSALLVKSLAEELKAAQVSSLAAITVSEAGARVVRRFGLEYTGDLVCEGEKEQVFAGPFAPAG